jgi:LmbE family N-acetylglucosaminyl deacetylase
MLPISACRRGNAPLRLLVLGAHSDDIEIGCGGTIMKLLDDGLLGEIWWVVLTGETRRAAEAQSSADALLADVPEKHVILKDFRDGYFPYDGAAIKDFFEQLKRDVEPDLILTHQRGDLHQDHRVTCDLTWNTFRDHLILEYEIPKYDGDTGTPNLFVPLDAATTSRKLDHLMKHFGTQSSKRWFDEQTFSGLMRLRGMECASNYAEAFYSRKAILA